MSSLATNSVSASSTTPTAALPLADWTRRVFWGGLCGLIFTAVGLTKHRSESQSAALLAAQEASQAQAQQQLQLAVDLAREISSLSETADTSGLERHLTSVLSTLPTNANGAYLQAELHQQLATMATQRSDFSQALAALDHADALATTPTGQAEIALQRLEIYLAADHGAQLVPPKLPEVSKLVSALPTGPEQRDAQRRLQILTASIASAQAEAATEQDQLDRELKVALLKRKGQALSEQLRGDMTADYQKREQAQQEAATNNDPVKMAAALQEKEKFDEKFSAELKRREEQLQQEAAAAMQPNPDITTLQAAAVQAWQQLSSSIGDSPLATRVHLGLAEALWLQQDFPAASSALQPCLTAENSSPLEKIRALHLNARIHESQASRLGGSGATAALQQALNAASQAQELVAKISLQHPAMLERASAVESTLASVHQALGQKPSSQQFLTLSEQHQQAAAQDHGWREILWNAQHKLKQLRQALREKYEPALVDQLQQAQTLLTSLREWQAQLLVKADAAPAASKVQAIIQQSPDQFPWASLLKSIH